MEYRWVYLTNDQRVCDGCGRKERLVKTRSDYTTPDGKMGTKVTENWVSVSKRNNPTHGAKCPTFESIAAAKSAAAVKAKVEAKSLKGGKAAATV